MSRNDINRCCEIEKTAMVTYNASVLKLNKAPKEAYPFTDYYVHFSRFDGVFGVAGGSPKMGQGEANSAYQTLADQLIIRYGHPTAQTRNEMVWNQPLSAWGLYRVSLRKGEREGGSQIAILYLFDNNNTYQ